jgi:hypothetical protein
MNILIVNVQRVAWNYACACTAYSTTLVLSAGKTTRARARGTRDVSEGVAFGRHAALLRTNVSLPYRSKCWLCMPPDPAALARTFMCFLDFCSASREGSKLYGFCYRRLGRKTSCTRRHCHCCHTIFCHMDLFHQFPSLSVSRLSVAIVGMLRQKPLGRRTARCPKRGHLHVATNWRTHHHPHTDNPSSASAKWLRSLRAPRTRASSLIHSNTHNIQ